MKKIGALFLVLVMMVGLVGCSGGVSKEEYDALQKRYNELEQEQAAQSTYLTLFDTPAKMIHEDAETVELSDSVVGIIVPFDLDSEAQFGEDMEEKLAASFMAISDVLLKTSTYEMCMLIFEDSKSGAVFGFSITEEGAEVFSTSKNFTETEPLEETLASFEIAGKVFSEEASVAHLSDSMIQVTIPYPKEQTEDDEDFRKKMAVLMQGVGLGLLSTEYDSCLVVFVENGECYMGATFKNDGSMSTFVIEE